VRALAQLQACRGIDVTSYNAYQWDFSLRTKARVVPVPVGHMDEGFEPDSIEVYKRTVDDLRAKGVKPRALVGPQLVERVLPLI
jgi:1-aminocyclopropane-1-carboxylate synthase